MREGDLDINGKIKKMFRKPLAPVIETSQRVLIPDGFLDNYGTVLAKRLKCEERFCGARLYAYEKQSNSLNKVLIKEINEEEWLKLQQSIEEAKNQGYLEISQHENIPSILCKGQHGIYATKVKKYTDGSFVNDGVHIYQKDENLRLRLIRKMTEKTWNKFYQIVVQTRQNEEIIRRQATQQLSNISIKIDVD